MTVDAVNFAVTVNDAEGLHSAHVSFLFSDATLRFSID